MRVEQAHGGGIFSLLPVAAENAWFDRFFATSHTYRFSLAAAQFGCAYAAPEKICEFEKIYTAALGKNIVTVIEVVVPYASSVAGLRALGKTVQSIIKPGNPV